MYRVVSFRQCAACWTITKSVKISNKKLCTLVLENKLSKKIKDTNIFYFKESSKTR